MAGMGYSLHNVIPVATVAVNDDDDDPPADKPVVSVQAGAGVITEGDDATFTLTASPAPEEDLRVEVYIDTSGRFAEPGVNRWQYVTVPTSGTATYTAATAG